MPAETPGSSDTPQPIASGAVERLNGRSLGPAENDEKRTDKRFEGLRDTASVRAERIRDGFAKLLGKTSKGSLAREETELAALRKELDSMTGDTAKELGSGQVQKFDTLISDQYAGEETVGKALDSLKSDEGDFGEQAVQSITKNIKQILASDKPLPSGFSLAIGKRPELMEQMVESSKGENVSDWDRLAMKAGLHEAAQQIAKQHVVWNGYGPDSKDISDETLVAEDKKMAEQIRTLATEIPVAGTFPAELLRKYSDFEEQGVTVEAVNTYNTCKDRDRNTPPTVEEITFISERYKSASEATKLLLNQHWYDPVAVLRIDDYLGSLSLDPELSNDNQLGQIDRLARMLGCDEDSSEISLLARESFADLMQRGATVDGLMKLFPHSQQYEKFLTTEPGEQFEESKDLLATVASLKGFKYDKVKPEGVVEDILAYPEMYKPAIGVIKESWDKVLESGYPADLASIPVELIFSQYAINLTTTYRGEPHNDYRANYIDANFRAMQILGESSSSLLRLSRGNEPKVDHFASNLADELREGKAVEADKLRNRFKEAADGLQTIATDHPDIYAALLLRTDITHTGDLREIAAYTAMAVELVKRQDLIDMLPNDLGSTALEGFVARIVKGMDQSTRTFPQEIFDSLDDLKEVISSNNNFDKQRLMEVFVGWGKGSKEFREFLLSPEVQEPMNDEKLASEINNALFIMKHEMDGNYDLRSAIDVYQGIDRPFPGYLRSIISNVAKLGGSTTSEAAQMYCELAPRILSRRDKDGNPYDSPNMLYLAIEPLSRYKSETYEGNLNWFLGDDLPIAAAESIIHFREEAINAGIEDRPTAVYEWVHKDPEKIAELSHRYLREYVNGTLAMSRSDRKIEDLETTDRLIETMGSQVDQMSDNFRLFVNISPSVIQKVVEGGGTIRSMLEIDSTYRDNNYLSQRSGIEIAMGIRSMNDSDEHPVYGSCGYIGDGVPSGASGYGEVMLTFKQTPELASRISYSPEDSFHGPYRLTSRDAQILRMIKNGQGQGHSRMSEYVETQTKSGLNISAVDQIYVPSEEMTEKLQSVLPPELHDKIIVRPEEGDYAATRERALYNLIVPMNGET